MVARMTAPARRVVALARDEARELRHDFVGTEHFLLGLLREQDGLGGRTLTSLGVSLEDARRQVVRIVGAGKEDSPPEIPLTPRATTILTLAPSEPLTTSDHAIGTEHILLRLAFETEGLACRILLDIGVDAETIRNATIENARISALRPPKEHDPERV